MARLACPRQLRRSPAPSAARAPLAAPPPTDSSSVASLAVGWCEKWRRRSLSASRAQTCPLCGPQPFKPWCRPKRRGIMIRVSGTMGGNLRGGLPPRSHALVATSRSSVPCMSRPRRAATRLRQCVAAEQLRGDDGARLRLLLPQRSGREVSARRDACCSSGAGARRSGSRALASGRMRTLEHDVTPAATTGRCVGTGGD